MAGSPRLAHIRLIHTIRSWLLSYNISPSTVTTIQMEVHNIPLPTLVAEIHTKDGHTHVIKEGVD